MALTPGTRLGVYEITAEIGKGGMGEVYRATDTKLKRQVAIKVLPASLAGDADRLARFQREAEVLASLNHPNIAAIHGLEDSDGVKALVMELVEGSTLADRIAQGALPLDETLLIARQIAEALEAAHEQGIIHRDLKPANVKVRDDGTVKVLDFGLAKAMDPAAASSPEAANSPTITSPAMTARGVILGTAAYMAPEQARGKAVDKRADIWAFGCVLSEMLTGRRPFADGDIAETMAAIIKDPPNLDGVPPSLVRLVQKCLEKDPRRRLRDIGDAMELADVGERAAPKAPAPFRRWAWIAGFVVAAVAVGTMVVTGFGSHPEPAPLSATRFVEALPENITIPRSDGIGTAVAVSPDGSVVVYRAMENGEFRLYRRFLDQLEAVPIGDVGAGEPFFSADGRWVGFGVGSSLKRVPVAGGTTVLIATLPYSTFRGASWSGDGTILVGAGPMGLQRITENGADRATLVEAPAGRRIWYPQSLPGGRAALYTERTEGTPVSDELVAIDLETRATKRIVPGFGGRYLSTGHVIFMRAGTLWAVRFDPGRLAVIGTPSPVLENVYPVGATGMSDAMQAAVTESGALLYIRGATNPPRTLVWVNRGGGEQPLGTPARAYANPRVSPDGNLVAMTTRTEGGDVWIWDVSRQHLRQLTSDPAPNFLAEWFPDGKRLAISVVVDGAYQVYSQAADGSGVPQPLAERNRSGDREFPNAIARDGSLLYSTWNQGAVDIGVLRRGSANPRATLVNTAAIERNVAISPDDRWIAFESNRTGRNEIYVRPYATEQGGEWPVTRDGGSAPVWARNGKELFYWRARGTTVSIMAVPIVTGSSFGFGEAHELFQGAYANPIWDRQYDVAPDGRFVMLKAVDFVPRDEIVVVQNWFQELKRLVPTQ